MSASFGPSWAVLATALLLDLLFGEPPNRLHPVVWMGRLTSALQGLAPQSGAIRQLAFGGFVAAFVPVMFVLASSAAVAGLGGGSLVGFVLAAMLLKSSFSFRALGEAAGAVRGALAGGDLGAGREALRSLCSRDPRALGEPELVAATVESLAENASDSFVAPLFYYGILGLPGAVFYRAANTLDAMIGYHGRFEFLGKAAARLDDVLNLVPARLTAALLLLAGSLAREDARRGWRILLRDGSKTESPNAGWPMAAMAGILGVELEKEGHYTLGDPIESIEVGKIDEAWRVVRVAAGLAVAFYAALLGARYAWAR
jgi:adenosylcobinamide-phosphate synthase